MKPHPYLRPTPDGSSLELCIGNGHAADVYELETTQLIRMHTQLSEWASRILFQEVTKGNLGDFR